MKTSIPALALSCLLLASCGASEPIHTIPAPPPLPPLPKANAARKRVTLQVDASTWIKDQKPFDVAGPLKAALAGALVDVVDEGTAKPDGVVMAEYEETQGEEYKSMYGMGSHMGYATVVKFKLAVMGPSTEVLFSASCTATTPSTVQGTDQLHSGALDAFRKTPLFEQAGTFVAAAVGVRRALPKLLPALLSTDTREQALAILDRAGFLPADAREDAYLAIAREDYDRCVTLGRPAVDPLLEFFGAYHWPKIVVKVAGALGEIGDPKAARPLLKRAVERARDGSHLWDDDHEIILALLEAVGKIGDSFCVPELDSLSKNQDKKVAAAALKALEAVRKRAR